MPKSKSVAKKSTYLIIAIALGLAIIGYYGYRSMLTTPDINKITGDDNMMYKPSKSKQTPLETTPKKCSSGYSLRNGKCVKS